MYNIEKIEQWTRVKYFIKYRPENYILKQPEGFVK